MAALTSTSYAILGLLAVKPWTTYELAQQMDRALGRFWPRAESRLYELQILFAYTRMGPLPRRPSSD